MDCRLRRWRARLDRCSFATHEAPPIGLARRINFYGSVVEAEEDRVDEGDELQRAGVVRPWSRLWGRGCAPRPCPRWRSLSRADEAVVVDEASQPKRSYPVARWHDGLNEPAQLLFQFDELLEHDRSR